MELKPIRTDGQPVEPGYRYDAPQDIATAEQGQKVLRNTYLLLPATMVPTIIGAFIGMASTGIILANPIIRTLVMLAAVFPMLFGMRGQRQPRVCPGPRPPPARLVGSGPGRLPQLPAPPRQR